MKRQTRPFTIEVKNKRTISKQGHSIWGDYDLSPIVAETGIELAEMVLPNRMHIDSVARPIDVEKSYKPQAEHLMADLKEAETAQTQTEVPAEGETPATKKTSPRPKTNKIHAKKPSQKTIAPAPAAPSSPAAPRKIYSEKERSQLLGQIEKTVGRGDSVKAATKQAGISEQTYYHWKKAKAPVSTNSDLKDLLALEEENIRLKKLLAEHLRNENAELKKKLGLN